MSLLEHGDFAQAAVPLSKAARLDPEKTSIREALGRAYFRTRRYAEAAEEFEAVVERYPSTTSRTSASVARWRRAAARTAPAATSLSRPTFVPSARTTAFIESAAPYPTLR